VLGILLEPIKKEFGVNDTAMGFLSGLGFTIFYATAGIPLARWADVGVRRTLISILVAFWSCATMACGLAASYVQLAIARIGVAVGEGGGQPAAQSMLADMYPLSSRATALAVLGTGNAFGVAAGLFLGGWLNAHFSWRIAFVVVGIPGLIVALIMRFTVKEPIRGMADGIVTATDVPRPSVGEVLHHLWKLKSFRAMLAAATLAALTSYAVISWVPTFFLRVHHLNTAQVGLWLGISTAIGLLIGNVTAGRCADTLGKRDLRWYMRIAAFGLAAATPFAMFFLSLPSAVVALTVYALVNMLMTAWVPPIYAMIQTLAPTRMRGVAAGILSFCQNLVGLGLGPLIIGMLNDHFTPRYGQEAIRYSLTIVSVGFLLAAVFAVLANRWIVTDYAASRE
jgi:predicted MFS family arabinose efflux permease